MSQTAVKENKKFNLDSVVNVATKIGGWMGRQRHLAALRDAFGSVIPFLIIGATSLLIRELFLSPTGLIGGAMGIEVGDNAVWDTVHTYVSPAFTAITAATLDLMGLWVVLGIGYNLSRSYGQSPMIGALIAGTSFFMLNPIAAGNGWAEMYLGARGLLMGMIIAMLSTTLFAKLSDFEKIKINMPAGVPPAIAGAFNVLIPISLTMLVFAWIQPSWQAIAVNFIEADPIDNSLLGTLSPDGSNWFSILNNTQISEIIVHLEAVTTATFVVDYPLMTITVTNPEVLTKEVLNTGMLAIGIPATVPGGSVQGTNYYYLIDAFNNAIGKPLATGVNNPGMIFAVIMLMGLFFFFGLHGPAILAPVLEAFWGAQSAENAQLYGLFGEGILEQTQALVIDGTNVADQIKYLNALSLSEGFSWADHATNLSAGMIQQGSIITNGLESAGIELWTWTKVTMDSFVTLGGSGATLGLLFGMKLMGRRHIVGNQLTNLSMAPGLFNINEPVIFGLPIMLNFSYLIPFTLLPAGLGIGTWAVVNAGWMNPTINLIPWTAPVFVSGLLGTGFDVMSTLVSSVNLLIMILFWIPFIMMDMKVIKKSQDPEAPLIKDHGAIGIIDMWWNSEEKVLRKEKKAEKLAAKNSISLNGEAEAPVVKKEADLTVDFTNKTVVQLKAIASTKSIELPKDADKSEIIEILEREYNDKKRTTVVMETSPEKVPLKETPVLEVSLKEAPVVEVSFKETSAAKKEVKTSNDLEDKTMAQLKAIASAKSIILPKEANKVEIIEILEQEYNKKKLASTKTINDETNEETKEISEIIEAEQASIDASSKEALDEALKLEMIAKTQKAERELSATIAKTKKAEKALIQKEKAEKIRAEKAKLKAEKIEKDLAQKAKLKAEKLEKDLAQKAKLKAEKIEKDSALKAKLKAEKIEKDLAIKTEKAEKALALKAEKAEKALAIKSKKSEKELSDRLEKAKRTEKALALKAEKAEKAEKTLADKIAKTKKVSTVKAPAKPVVEKAPVKTVEETTQTQSKNLLRVELSNRTTEDLRHEAKKINATGYSKANKTELVEIVYETLVKKSTRAQLNKWTKDDLKHEARKLKAKGYSKADKDELVEIVFKALRD